VLATTYTLRRWLVHLVKELFANPSLLLYLQLTEIPAHTTNIATFAPLTILNRNAKNIAQEHRQRTRMRERRGRGASLSVLYTLFPLSSPQRHQTLRRAGSTLTPGSSHTQTYFNEPLMVQKVEVTSKLN
jgi:hypothetical protein